MTTEEGPKWVCLYCRLPIVEADRARAVKALLGGTKVGRAHPACKARAITEQGRWIWGTGESWRSKAVR